MMVIVAFLIAVAAVSLMMTVLVASTRPLRAYDEPVYGARSASKTRAFDRNPSWTELGGPVSSGNAPRAPGPIAPYASSLPPSAPAAPEASGKTTSRVAPQQNQPTPPRPAPRATGRINPNTWGRIRAEVEILETRRHRAL